MRKESRLLNCINGLSTPEKYPRERRLTAMIYILTMEINGFEILLAPGGKVEKVLENAMVCEIHFDNENDLRKAYDALMREGQNCSINGPFPWATLLALVIDKFGIAWALYFNEET